MIINNQDYICIGTIVMAHGRFGKVKAKPSVDESLFKQLIKDELAVFDNAKTFRPVSMSFYKGLACLDLGLQTVEQAQEYCGNSIYVPRVAFSQPIIPEDLIGAKVYYNLGSPRGNIFIWLASFFFLRFINIVKRGKGNMTMRKNAKDLKPTNAPLPKGVESFGVVVNAWWVKSQIFVDVQADLGGKVNTYQLVYANFYKVCVVPNNTYLILTNRPSLE